MHFIMCTLQALETLEQCLAACQMAPPSLFGHGQGRDRHQSAVLDVIMARMDYGLATPGVTSDAAFNS